MFDAVRKTLAATGVLAAAAAGGSAIAGGSGSGDRAERSAETPLTGDTAEKVKAAALAKIAGGTIVRVETDADHGSPYEAHVRRSDGIEVEVLVNENFEVTAVYERGRGFGGPGGHHGPGGPALAALARELGVSRARLRSALEAIRPDGPPDHGDLAADLADALGVERSAVQHILDANRPLDRRGPHDGRDGLVAALADGLNIDAATVEAALQKLHDARESEFAAKLAKQLGISADRVEQALEAGAPRRP